MIKSVITSSSRFIPKTIQSGNTRQYPIIERISDPNSSEFSYGLTLLNDFPRDIHNYIEINNSDHPYRMYIRKEYEAEYRDYEQGLTNAINSKV